MIEPNSATDDVVTTREAAERLGVAVRTIQLWVESGVLSAWKTAGGHRRITRASLDELLASRVGAVAKTASAPKDNGPFRVLVVEDDPSLQMLFQMVLEGMEVPLQVELADNGFDALLKMGVNAPHMLITDLNMPGMDGFSMIRHLRESSQWTALPIVVVSALSARDIEARGGLPADIPRFGKPLPFQDLEALIRVEVARRAAGGAAKV